MKLSRAAIAVAVTMCALIAGAGPAAGTAAPASSAAGAGAVSSAAGAGAVSSAAAPYCGITWGSAGKSGGALSQGALIDARTGRHECFDRVVFELNGPATGYTVAYGEVYTDGEGLALSPYTAGGALLDVRLLNPAYDDSHVATYPHRTGDHVASVLRYQTLRDVVFGGSFEGYTTFAVGVRARLPFQVTVLSGPGTHSRIVLDIAHAW